MLVEDKGRDDGRWRDDLGMGLLSEQGRHHHQQAELTGGGTEIRYAGTLTHRSTEAQNTSDQLQFEPTILIPAPFPISFQGVQGPDCRDAGVGRSDSCRGRGFGGGGDDCGVRRLGNLPKTFGL